MKPNVSIIVPCFNQGRFLSDALNSLLAQSITSWECIVIDDGSTDDTREVALRYATRDPRIRLVSQKNRGLAGARNCGLELASGRYIQFLDADDLIEPEKLALQVEALNAAKTPCLSYTDYRYCTEDDVEKTTTRDNFPPPRFLMERRLYDIAARWESGFSIPCHCFLFDSYFFRERNIRFDETLPNHEDWDCWMRVFALDPDVFHIEGRLAVYRLHNASMCTNHERMQDGFRMAIKKQKNLLKHDTKAIDILDNRLLEQQRAYQPKIKENRLSRISRKALSSLRRTVPWPLQRFFIGIGKKLS